MSHPTTRRDSLILDDLHGTPVADPYRWLEDQTSPEVADWVDAQQAHTEAWLATIPQREEIRKGLAAVWDYPKVGIPWRRGEQWFQHRNSGMQEQAVLWTMASPEQEGHILLDPAELSDDGTVSLSSLSITADGTLLAYGTSDGGSDWITWNVRDIASGTDLSDTVHWAKFAGAAWAPDNSGFFYGAYDPPVEGEALSATNTHHQLRFHRLGDQDPDVVVYRREDEPEWGFSPGVTEDGRWLVVTVWQGTEPRSRIHLAPLDVDPAAVAIQPWLDDFDAEYSLIGSDGDTLVIQTDLEAPGGRVLAIDAADAAVRTELIAEDTDPLLSVSYIGGRLIVVRLTDAVHRVVVHERNGVVSGTVVLPDLGSIGGISGREQDPVALVSVSSFTQSAGIYRLDPAQLTLQEIREPSVRVPAVLTEQVMVDSTDGARVPLFLIRPAAAKPEGTLPTILYGYGGFGIPLSPEFRLWWTVWLERGGAIAVGCYRGGSEYGRDWHDAGRLANKAHTFDDALACAAWLAESGWTRPSRIAITGGSNGGLTAAAAMIRHPEAFGACVPEVGVLDLLRFHKFTIGWGWKSDYGDPDDPVDFPLIHSLSPLHTLTPGTAYPATLIVTADTDDRVVPAHSFKFAAALQAAQGGEAPVLARIDTRAGHGAGTPTSKQIDARTDVIAFLESALLDTDGAEVV